MASHLATPTSGLILLLDSLRLGWADTLRIALYRGNYTPQITDTIATYLPIEANYNGYGRKPIMHWLAPDDPGDGLAYTMADFVIWEPPALGTTQLVYGYFVVNSDGDLLWAQRDDGGPRAMSVNGPPYVIRPGFKLGRE